MSFGAAVLCPVCRAEVNVQARRCFLEGQCPVCLATDAPLFILTCGHAVCEGDLSNLGLTAEKPRVLRRRLSAFKATNGAHALQTLISLLVFWGAIRDPGAPFQWAFSFWSFFIHGDDAFCVDACFSAKETDHRCKNHCDCDGVRTCSFFGYCIGTNSEQCGEARSQWPVNVSFPLVVPLGHRSFTPQMTYEYRLNSSQIHWTGKLINDSAWASSWSPAFDLGGMRNLSLQIRSDGKSGWDNVSMGLRGPDGHFIRSQVQYAGRNYTLQRATPMDAHEQGAQLATFLLRECPMISSSSASLGPCGYLKFLLLEVSYFPTFTFGGTARFGAFPRKTSLAIPIDVAGIGRLFLRIFPAGTDSVAKRCAVFLTGTVGSDLGSPGSMGVALDLILRVGSHVMGDLETPLHCADAGKGCLFQDAGPSWRDARWNSVAVSLVAVKPFQWQMPDP